MLENWQDFVGNGHSVAFQEFEGKRVSDSLHAHGCGELVFVTRGEGNWQIGTVKGDFRVGSLLYCPAGMLHAWGGENVSAVVLRFGRSALPKGLMRLPEMGALRAFRDKLDQPLVFEVLDRDRLRARLRSVDRAQGVLRLARLHVALELVASLRRRQIVESQELARKRNPRGIARMERVRQFLLEHLGEEIGRSEVAREVGLEEAAFSRFFREATGTTFIHYLANLRVQRAATLLGNRRDLSVPEVACLSGFRNLSGFHRQFKKRLGTTPEAYRRAANAETLAP